MQLLYIIIFRSTRTLVIQFVQVNRTILYMDIDMHISSQNIA